MSLTENGNTKHNNNDDDVKKAEREHIEEPPAKRTKTGEGRSKTGDDDDETDLTSIMNEDAIAIENEKELVEQYKSARPYPHGQIRDVFRVDFIQNVREEIKQNSKVNFKETDLFRVYQSIDMANLHLPQNAELARSMPSIMKLRNVLYSSKWRRYVERLTNLPPFTLTDKVDCACNCHAPGCHLLCHDDVITTRKVSYIIYLTEEDWKPSEGGALELYDSHPEESTASSSDNDANDNDNVVVQVPNSSPSKLVLPHFNSMGYFVVQPGVSFHAVQEVYGERPRLSLQGWYHASSVPENIEMATLNRLKQYKSNNHHHDSNNNDNDGDDDNEKKDDDDDDDDKQVVVAPDDGDGHYFIPWNQKEEEESSTVAAAAPHHKPLYTKLLDADRDYLAQYIHETYLCKTSMEEIRQRFEEDSSVQLKNFFREEWISKCNTAMKQDDQTNKPPILRASSQNQQQQPSDGTTKNDKKGEGAIAATATTTSDSLDYYQWGVSDDWKLRGPSHKQRYLEYVENDEPPPAEKEKNDKEKKQQPPPPHDPANDNKTTGELLSHLKQNVLQSAAFGRYLHYVTSLGVPLGYRGQIRRFRPGLDYTVAHYGLLMDRSVLDATMCFVVSPTASNDDDNTHNNDNATDDTKTAAAKGEEKEEKNDDDDDDDDDNMIITEEDVMWQSGDCGGFECYIEADDIDNHSDDGEEGEEGGGGAATSKSKEAADEYNAADDSELLSVSACNNTLSLVYRDPGTMRFVKYVGSKAPSSRWDICMEYKVEEPEDDDGEEDDAVILMEDR